MKQHSLLFIPLWLLLSQSCKKNNPEPLTLLPPATQTGANTFGCLVNGQGMLPEGNNGAANYDVAYDPTFMGGSLDVRAYQITKKHKRFIILGGTQINRVGVYPLSSGQSNAFYTDTKKDVPCQTYSSSNPATTCQGTLTVTRLDLTAGIIAGTFAFTMVQPGCDTIKVTEGRFDNRL